MFVIDESYARNLLIERPSDMHKGQAGHVLIIAGSRGMAGASVLCTRGCLRAGAGIIKVCVPNDLFDILQISVPEAMCIDRNEFSNINLAEFHSIVIGPGIRVNSDNYSMIVSLLSSYKGVLVIDADGLNCLAKFGIQPLVDREEPVIITPHPGEADRLMKSLEIGSYDPAERERVAHDLSKATGAVTLLKGEGTLIAYGDQCFKNTTGNPGMATGGSGDVLAGIIAAFAAAGYLGLEPLQAAALGAFAHGLAGDFASKEMGQISMSAGNIADNLNQALKLLTLK